MAEGACDGDGWLESDEAGGRVGETWAPGDDGVEDGVGRVGVVSGDGVLVGDAVRDGDGSSDGDPGDVGDGLMVDAGTTTPGEAGTSGGRTNR